MSSELVVVYFTHCCPGARLIQRIKTNKRWTWQGYDDLLIRIGIDAARCKRRIEPSAEGKAAIGVTDLLVHDVAWPRHGVGECAR